MVKTEPPKEHRGLLIPTKLIRPNRFNPRTEKDKESDIELFESVKKRGVETEIHVRPLDAPDEERQREVAKEIVSHPDLKWHEARLLVSEAREEPETPAPELARRRLEHHEPRRPTFVMSAKDYEDIKAGKKRVLIEPTFRPGFHEDTIIDPLIKAEPLKIADVFKRPLGRFKEMDAESAGYGTLEDFKQAWIEKHGGWADEQVVYIYLFK